MSLSKLYRDVSPDKIKMLMSPDSFLSAFTFAAELQKSISAIFKTLNGYLLYMKKTKSAAECTKQLQRSPSCIDMLILVCGVSCIRYEDDRVSMNCDKVFISLFSCNRAPFATDRNHGRPTCGRMNVAKQISKTIASIS